MDLILRHKTPRARIYRCRLRMKRYVFGIYNTATIPL